MDFNSIKDPLVRDYVMKKYGKVDDAQAGVDQANAMSAVAGLGDMISNAGNKPQVLENRMQDLGKAPTIIEPRQQKTDVSGLQKQAQMKLAQAQSDEDNAVKTAFEQRKAELAQEVAAKRAEEDAKRFQLKYDQDERAMQLRGQTKQSDPLMEMIRTQQLEKLQRENKQSVGNQGKPLPAELAAKLSGYQAAENIVNELSKNWDANASGLGSSVLGVIPGTDANNYDKSVDPAVQAFGSALEGGKLTDNDFSKYKGMAPGKGDTAEQKKAKVAALLQNIKMKREAELNMLKQSGYAVPGSNQTKSAAPHGQKVSQDGKTYEWDGAQYVEVK